MFNRRDTHSSKAILASRRRNEQIETMTKRNNDIKAHQRYLDFEIKAQDIVRKTHLNRIADGLRQKEAENLDHRRKRLAELLGREEIIFQEEIDQKVESVDQRYKRMSNRAKELRNKRDSARQKKADELYYQRFRLECDELRTVDVQKHTKLIIKERDKQVTLNRALNMKKREMEDEYARMWLEDGRKKEARHQSDLARIKKLNDEQSRALKGQMMEKERAAEQERRRLVQEKEDIRRQAEADERLAVERKKEIDDENRRVQEQVYRYNQLRQMQKSLAKKQELDDGAELNRINKEAIEREKREVLEKKLRLKQDHDKFMGHMNRMKASEEAYQENLQRYIQAEVDRANHKKDMELQAREDARNRLMANVHKSRQENLKYKFDKRLEAKRQKQQDRDEMRGLEEEYKRFVGLEKQQRYQRRKQIEKDQLKLIAQKDQKKTLERAMARHERLQAEERDRRLEAWIEKEKNDPNVKKPWHGLTKNNWYT
ncbi:hypothetical protein AAMO2058_000897600 [Amorphochlora amoebiformis]